MSQLIPQETINYLKSNPTSIETARKVLKMLIKSEKTSEESEIEVYIVLQAILASNYSPSRIHELLTSLKFPEDFISDFSSSLSSLPKIRSGVVLPMLVDVNWKSVHEVSTSSIRKIHVPAISVEPVIQETSGEFSSLAFTCTKPQLAELVYKLKSALQQIDKLYKN